MRWRQLHIRAVSAFGLAMLVATAPARAEGMLIQFNGGVLCDEAGQIEEIVAQFEQKPLREVLVALNTRTGKVSCGMVRQPLTLMMEPEKLVSTPGGKMVIIKLTTPGGLVQFTWKRIGEPEPPRQNV